MFNQLKSRISLDDTKVSAMLVLAEMADGGAMEDEILDNIVIPEDDEKQIEVLLKKIPDDPIGNSEEITDSDLEDAVSNVPDPTIDEILQDEEIF